MKYKGKELVEMTQENWDGKSRRMLAWCDDYKPWLTMICGYNPLSKSWICADSSIGFSHCAEIPNDESNEKFSIDYIIKTLTERTQYEYWMPFDNCIVEYLKELKELKVENEKLRKECIASKESEELKIKIKPKYDFVENMLKDAQEQNETYPRWDFVENIMKTIPERKGSFTISKRAVELMRNIEKACGIVYEKNKKLKEENEKLKDEIKSLRDYKSENKQIKKVKTNLKVGKWYYCYKDLKIPNAVRSCCIPTAIEGNFVFDGKFFVVPNASLIVDDDYVTYDLNTTIIYEASMFDKIEELQENKPHKINDSWVDEWLSNTCVDKDACNEPMIKE